MTDPAATPPSGASSNAPSGPPHKLETLTDALTHWRAQGFEADFTATAEGTLRCEECGNVLDPEQVTIVHRQRFEGATNPGDMDILLALRCDCGCQGVFTSAFGPNAPAENAEVLRRLAGRTPEGDADDPDAG